MSEHEWDDLIRIRDRMADLGAEIAACVVAGVFAEAHRLSVEVMLLEREREQLKKKAAA